jgi:DNA polymerase
MSYKEKILELGKKCYDCKKCPLGQTLVDDRDPHVFSVGRVPSEIMFVAEAPGADEVKLRKPLVGRSGKFFDSKILEVAGLERKDVYITNTVLCRPAKNRTPLPGEIEACREHLDAQICLVNPKLIIPLGNVPLLGITGQTGITKKRGKLQLSKEWSNGEQYWVFPMFHPSYCLRGSGLKETEADAKIILQVLSDVQNHSLHAAKEIM